MMNDPLDLTAEQSYQRRISRLRSEARLTKEILRDRKAMIDCLGSQNGRLWQALNEIERLAEPGYTGTQSELIAEISAISKVATGVSE